MPFISQLEPLSPNRESTNSLRRNYAKVIKMEKSPKTGAYTFKEEMVPNDAVKDFFAK